MQALRRSGLDRRLRTVQRIPDRRQPDLLPARVRPSVRTPQHQLAHDLRHADEGRQSGHPQVSGRVPDRQQRESELQLQHSLPGLPEHTDQHLRARRRARPAERARQKSPALPDQRAAKRRPAIGEHQVRAGQRYRTVPEHAHRPNVPPDAGPREEGSAETGEPGEAARLHSAHLRGGSEGECTGDQAAAGADAEERYGHSVPQVGLRRLSEFR